MATAALIVGLGNPGPPYERTRHNIGFRVADALASRLGARFKPKRGTPSLVAEARDGDRRLVLAKPTTYMNESGAAVGALVRSTKATLAQVLVVHDDLDLPLGTIRVKRGGSDAGHNGLTSVSGAVGRDYSRVRCGIGRPPGSKDPRDYVLEPFSRREEEEVAVVVEEAADAVLLVLREGVARAQNLYHARTRADEDV